MQTRDGHLVTGSEVITRREATASALDNDAVDRPVIVGLPEGLGEFRLHFQGQSIQLVRPVQRDPGAAVCDLVENLFEHGCLSPQAGTSML